MVIIVFKLTLQFYRLDDEMEPVQQFCEVKGKFPKFVPSTTIPTSGTKNLKTLELQQVKEINLMNKIFI